MIVEFLNSNKIFFGISMLISNIGSKLIVDDIKTYQNYVQSSNLFKVIIIFFMFFVGTRDIVIALILTTILCILLSVFFLKKEPLPKDFQTIFV